ncbi:MAG TPA: 2-hydroxyacid dehydrogenase, partial [Cytophagales bacterium]|nr:2-hydroxyacid dehydrogenase [Cytophagales bacterium]
VCVFVNDVLNASVIEDLAHNQVKTIALRCAGFNNVDLAAAKAHGLRVVRVPSYSPHAVAEHALALLLTLNRKTHKAYNRVREGNFSLQGLEGFDLFGKTIGVIGVGNIGRIFINIMKGFGCKILVYDIVQDPELLQQNVTYVPLERLFHESDVISLHCPLNAQTKYLINKDSLSLMKEHVYIVNTGRGGLIHTKDVIEYLKNGKIGGLALDVYEQESALFFSDHSADIIQDDQLLRLTTFPNVIITSHQGFFTQEALTQIAQITLNNINDIAAGRPCANEVSS